MKSFRPLHINWYVVSDALTAAVAWFVLALVRKHLLHEHFSGLYSSIIADPFFQTTVLIIPLFWVILFSLTGSYRQSLYRKSRLNEFTNTFIISLVGCLLIFFVLILNDTTKLYTYYYAVFFSFLFILIINN